MSLQSLLATARAAHVGTLPPLGSTVPRVVVPPATVKPTTAPSGGVQLAIDMHVQEEKIDRGEIKFAQPTGFDLNPMQGIKQLQTNIGQGVETLVGNVGDGLQNSKNALVSGAKTLGSNLKPLIDNTGTVGDIFALSLAAPTVATAFLVGGAAAASVVGQAAQGFADSSGAQVDGLNLNPNLSPVNREVLIPTEIIGTSVIAGWFTGGVAAAPVAALIPRLNESLGIEEGQGAYAQVAPYVGGIAGTLLGSYHEGGDFKAPNTSLLTPTPAPAVKPSPSKLFPNSGNTLAPPSGGAQVIASDDSELFLMAAVAAVIILIIL